MLRTAVQATRVTEWDVRARTDVQRALRRRIAVTGALALVVVAGGITNISCEDPVAALVGVTTVSTNVEMHVHRCTIPISDIDNPPSGGRSYVSTTVETHSHTVFLTETQLRDLQQPGAGVSVTSSTAAGMPPPPPSHNHRFDFVR